MKKGAKKTGQRTKSSSASAERYKSLSNMFGEGLRPLAEEFCHQMQMVGTAGAEKPVPSRCLSAGKPISGNNELFFGIHLSDHSSMCEGSILTKTPCGFSGSVDFCQLRYITWNNGPF